MLRRTVMQLLVILNRELQKNCSWDYSHCTGSQGDVGKQKCPRRSKPRAVWTPVSPYSSACRLECSAQCGPRWQPRHGSAWAWHAAGWSATFCCSGVQTVSELAGREGVSSSQKEGCSYVIRCVIVQSECNSRTERLELGCGMRRECGWSERGWFGYGESANSWPNSPVFTFLQDLSFQRWC